MIEFVGAAATAPPIALKHLSVPPRAPTVAFSAVQFSNGICHFRNSLRATKPRCLIIKGFR